jgi:hypothetical protein
MSVALPKLEDFAAVIGPPRSCSLALSSGWCSSIASVIPRRRVR